MAQGGRSATHKNTALISAWGQKRRNTLLSSWSTSPPNADIRQRIEHGAGIVRHLLGLPPPRSCTTTLLYERDRKFGEVNDLRCNRPRDQIADRTQAASLTGRRPVMTIKLPEIETRKQKDRKRVLLDSNIWRYVVDNRSQGALLQVARNGAYDVQIAPGVLYEALRLKDASLRATLVRLMTNRRFHRLMPEAYSESMEILHEIKRVQPDLLHDKPDLHWFNDLKKDWMRKTGGFWVRCARSPQREAGFVSQVERGMVPDARAASDLAREEVINAGWKKMPPMDEWLVKPREPVAGWRGNPVEEWRLKSLNGISSMMAERHAYHDWLAPFIKFDGWLIQRAAWAEFWLHLADKSALPRQWLRWAFGFAQRFRRVTPGTPCDTQLSTYFLETDVVVTADKALLDILEACRPYAPCQLPDGKLVLAGAPGVQEVLRMLSQAS